MMQCNYSLRKTTESQTLYSAKRIYFSMVYLHAHGGGMSISLHLVLSSTSITDKTGSIYNNYGLGAMLTISFM